jgi:hypothetical protein
VRADAPSVRVNAQVVPEQIVIHAQVQLRIEVTHPSWVRPRWTEPPFEGFWPERLSTTGKGLKGELAHLRTTVFRRALFPTRTGELEIAGSVVTYEDPHGTAHALPVPELRVVVKPIPEEGRPRAFGGLVGSLDLQASLVRNPIARGQSAQLLLEAYGEINAWDLEAPNLEAILGADVEVFPTRPRLSVGENGDRLTLRRTFLWDVVPTRSGFVEIPPIEVSYFDPTETAFRVARSEPLRLEVVVSAAALGSGSPFEPRKTRAPSARLGMATLVLFLLAGTVAVLFLVRWARRNAERLRRPPRPSRKAALRAARAAVGSNAFPGLLGRAVRAGIAVRNQFDPEGLTTEEIARRVDDPEGVRILESLDRIRFAREGQTAESLLDAVARYLED